MKAIQLNSLKTQGVMVEMASSDMMILNQCIDNLRWHNIFIDEAKMMSLMMKFAMENAVFEVGDAILSIRDINTLFDVKEVKGIIESGEIQDVRTSPRATICKESTRYNGVKQARLDRVDRVIERLSSYSYFEDMVRVTLRNYDPLSRNMINQYFGLEGFKNNKPLVFNEWCEVNNVSQDQGCSLIEGVLSSVTALQSEHDRVEEERKSAEPLQEEIRKSEEHKTKTIRKKKIAQTNQAEMTEAEPKETRAEKMKRIEGLVSESVKEEIKNEEEILNQKPTTVKQDFLIAAGKQHENIYEMFDASMPELDRRKITKKLSNYGIISVGELAGLSEEELCSVKGLGEKYVALIKNNLEYYIMKGKK